MSIKNKAFNIKKNATKALDIPEWETTVYLRKWSLTERSELLQFIRDHGDKLTLEMICEKILPISLCEEDGEPAMQPEDWPAFKNLDGSILDRITQAAQQFNGFGHTVTDDAKKN